MKSFANQSAALVACMLANVISLNAAVGQEESQQEKTFFSVEDVQQQLEDGKFDEPIAESIGKLKKLGARINGYESSGRWWIQLNGPTRFVSWDNAEGPNIETIESEWKGELSDLELLSALPSVRLSLEYFAVDKELLEAVSEISSVSKLKIGGGTLVHHDELFSSLGASKKLTSLELRTFYQSVLPTAFNSITEITSLEELSVSSAVPIAAGSLENLDRLSNLRILSLPSVDFSVCPAEKFHELNKLENLSLNGCSSIGKLIKGAKAFDRLTKLDLTGCDVSKLDFQMLTRALPQLQSLRICRPKIEPDVWDHIANYLANPKRLTELNHLHVDQRFVTHHQLARLKCARPDTRIDMMVVRGGLSLNWNFELNKTESGLLSTHQTEDPDQVFDLQQFRSDDEVFSKRVLIEDQLRWIHNKLESGTPFEIETVIEPLLAHQDIRAIPTLIHLLEIGEITENRSLQETLKGKLADTFQNAGKKLRRLCACWRQLDLKKRERLTCHASSLQKRILIRFPIGGTTICDTRLFRTGQRWKSFPIPKSMWKHGSSSGAITASARRDDFLINHLLRAWHR